MHNRGPEAAELHVLPTLWFRNTWSWGGRPCKPSLQPSAADGRDRGHRIPSSGDAIFLLRRRADAAVHRERNQHRAPLRHAQSDALRQGRHQRLRRHGPARRRQPRATEPRRRPTIALDGAAGRRSRYDPRCALDDGATAQSRPLRQHFDARLRSRVAEADEFYAAVTPAVADADRADVMRQALAGMLWSKQFYYYDVDRWLEERGTDPFKPTRHGAAQRRSGTTCTTPTSSRCRTSGNTRGTRPGTWRSTSRARRWSTPTSPRSS